jgi:hypothetical protein
MNFPKAFLNTCFYVRLPIKYRNIEFLKKLGLPENIIVEYCRSLYVSGDDQNVKISSSGIQAYDEDFHGDINKWAVTQSDFEFEEGEDPKELFFPFNKFHNYLKDMGNDV